MPIPLSAVRVVYPLQIPPQTDSLGNTTQAPYLQDTIIDRLIRLPNRRGRFIANSNLALGQWVEIPKPPPRPRKDPNSKDDKSPRAKPSPNESDTLRYQVEEATWTPTLLRAPMPASIIDELRGKYSKHRTRHEPSYELMLENRARRKAEYAAFAKGGGGMLSSPAKEARKMEIAEMREKKGKPELKREILERIGEVMKGKGVVMTGEREREVERNLKGEEVLSASTRETETETETEGSHWVDEEIEDDEEVGEQGLEGATGELPVNDATIENEGQQQGLGDDRRP